MPRDYKSSPRNTARGGGNPVLTGILIGLLLGLIIAVAVVLYINRGPSPFVNRAQAPETPGKAAKAQEKQAPEAIKPLQSDQATVPPEAKSPDKPRFDFYEILPGNKDAAKTAKENLARPAERPALPAPAPARPTEQAPVPKEALKDNVFLQAGAFQSAADADNQKAKLALLGFEANVAAAQIAGKGTLYRVRIGPYKSMAEANKVAGTLSQSGVATSVVKGDTPSN